MNEVLEEIMDVWGDYDDFDDLDYIGWLLEKEAREIRESNWDNAEKEVADIAICALRTLEERSESPEDVILERLDKRMKGNQEDIISRDKKKYSKVEEFEGELIKKSPVAHTRKDSSTE